MILPLPCGRENCSWIAPTFFVPDAVGSYQKTKDGQQRGPLVGRSDARHVRFDIDRVHKRTPRHANSVGRGLFSGVWIGSGQRRQFSVSLFCWCYQH